MCFKVGNVAGKRIRAIVNQLFSKLALFCVYFQVWGDVRWIDDSCIKPGFDGVIKKYAVEYRSSIWFQTERDVTYAEYGENSWQFCLYAFDCFKCFNARC